VGGVYETWVSTGYGEKVEEVLSTSCESRRKKAQGKRGGKTSGENEGGGLKSIKLCSETGSKRGWTFKKMEGPQVKKRKKKEKQKIGSPCKGEPKGNFSVGGKNRVKGKAEKKRAKKKKVRNSGRLPTQLKGLQKGPERTD